MDKPALIAAVDQFLKKHTTMTLATVDRQAWPQAADVFYAHDDALRLYFVSGDRSRHAMNLARVSRVAATVHSATWDWRDIQGVQIEGEARAIAAPEDRDRAWALFRAKFPFTNEFVDQIVRSTFYVVTPAWVRLIDNTRGFGHRQEISLP